MNNRLGVLLLLVGASAAQPAFAGDSATMKCDASHDRVWVYDSLTSFDVSAKLKCGESVEITGRVKGYVKIRAANGTEGYVPDSTFPGLPPFVDPNDTPADTAALAKITAARQPVHAVNAAPAPPVAPINPPAAIAAPVAATPKPAPSVAAVAQVPPPATTPAPAVVPVAKVSPSPAPATPPTYVAAAPSPVAAAPTSAVRTVSATSAPPLESASMTIEPMPADGPVAATAATAAAPAVGARSSSTPAPGKKSNSSTHASAVSSSPSATTKSSSPAASAKAANTKSATTQPQPSGSAHPAPTPSVPTPAAPSNAKSTESSASLQPAIQPSREVASVHTVSAVESDEDPGYMPENASADPACRTFFSAYGLSPAQAKWIAQNRKKQFSSVCPAPDPSKVDFVVIFTHDVDFFGSTLPTEIHRDQHGFSDFSPMTMLDSALIPQSEANKAHREYVWVFKMQRGAFDPSKFSPRRHPQFTKEETHAPARTVEEAFQFIESGAVSK
jgi:hypothetical protein